MMTLKKIPPGVPYPSPINKLMPLYLIKSSYSTTSLRIYGYRVNQMMTQGAPIDFVLIDPVISKPRGISLVKRAPHPYAAILFIDWALSQEGLSLIGQ